MRMRITAAGPLFRAGPSRALPRSCRPVQDETTGSYLLRLAAANQITGPDLIGYLTAGTSRGVANVSLTAVTTASGHPALALAYALPELRSQHPGHQAMALHGRTLPTAPNSVRPACRRCAASRGAGRIDIWYRHEQNTCHTHQLWTGPGADLPRDQPDLSAVPGIMHAQARHLRLIWRHSRPVVHTAYTAARLAWNKATYRGPGLPHIIMRNLPVPASFGHQDWPARPKDPVHSAASYPEIVNLTALLISLRWQSALSSAASYSKFLAELSHHIPLTFPALGPDAGHTLLMSILNASTPPSRPSPLPPETADDSQNAILGQIE
jgi:hypothetical protein